MIKVKDTQINNIKNEKGNIAADTTDNRKGYYE